MKLLPRPRGRHMWLLLLLAVASILTAIHLGVRAFSDGPEIALVIGEPWEAMRQRSSAAIDPAIPDVAWFCTPKSDARLRFVDPQYGFVTPRARFFTIGYADGKVSDIRLSPQAEPLLLDDALKIVLDLQAQWRKGGWRPVRTRESLPYADTPEWRTQLRDENRGGVVFWQAGDKYQAMLVVSRFEDDRHPDEERYLITLALAKPWLAP